MSREIPTCALLFLEKAEGCKLAAYRDSGGVWTIGWGHTGPDVVEGLVITLEQARFYLRADAAHAVRRLELAVGLPALSADVLTEHEYAALISFAFNLGVGPLPPKAGWEIWRDVKAGRLGQVAAEMMRFDKVRDRKTGQLHEVPGLVHRRSAEVMLWKTADVAASAAVIAAAPVQAPPSSFTRDADTPPTPASPKPLEQASLATKIAAGVTTLGAGAATLQASAEQLRDAIQPYVDQVHMLETITTVLIVGIAALTAVQIGIHAFQKRAAAL